MLKKCRERALFMLHAHEICINTLGFRSTALSFEQRAATASRVNQLGQTRTMRTSAREQSK